MRKELFDGKHFLTLFIGLAFGCQAYAQDPEFVWVKSMGSTDDESGIAISVDPQGNVYSVGRITDTISMDFGSAQLQGNGGNAYIVKQDSSGKLIWARMLPNTTIATAVALDPLGKEVYITGEYSGTVDFDPGSGSTTHTSALNTRGRPGTDFYISKFDSAGTFQWVRVAGASGAEGGKAVTVEKGSQHVLVTGSFSGTVDFGFGQTTTNLNAGAASGGFVLKITASGNIVWGKAYSGDGIGPQGIAVDKVNDVYVTGQYINNADFDPDPNNTVTLTSVAHYDIFVSKLTSAGNYVWAKSMGGPDYDHGAAITVDDSFNVYVTGGFQNSGNFDPNGTLALFSNGAEDAFVVKLKADGSLGWAANVGSYVDDQGTGIALDRFGNVYTSGNFQSPRSDFNPGTGPADTFNLVSYGGYDGYMLKLSNDGKFGWARNIGTKFGPDNTNGIAVGNGYIYTTGVFYNTADFDPAGGGLHQLTSRGNSDVYILKLFECQRMTGAELQVAGPDSVCFNQEYTYVVQPVFGAVSYEWILPQGWEGSSDSTSINVTTDDAEQGTIRVVVRGLCDSVVQDLAIGLVMPPVSITIDEFTLSTTHSGYYTSWQWYLNGKLIEGATEEKLVVDENGLYSVVVTGRHGCTDSTTYNVTNVPTSIDAQEKTSFIRLYPNPVTDHVQLLNQTGQPVDVVLLSMDGRELWQTSVSTVHHTILMSTYAQGVYLVQVRNKAGQILQTEKLLKN